MHWEIFFVLTLLICAVASFIWEKVTPDVTALTVFAVILAAGFLFETERLPGMEQTLGVFSNHAPLTVAGMFVLSAGLSKTGAIELITSLLRRLTRLPFPLFLFLMILGVATVSAFINNTPVVVVLLPVMLALAREMNVPASKLLIPLSFASIFGGTCTLIGTSTNLIGSGILVSFGYEPIGMYEISRIGVPILFVGAIYLVLFSGKLIPVRETLSSILTENERREFITEAYVRADSPLTGKTIDESGTLKARHIRVLEIVRNGVGLLGNPRTIPLQVGDRLVLSCRPSGVVEAHAVEGIDLLGEKEIGLEQIAADEGAIVEGMVAPGSAILGKTIQEIGFRQRFRMVIVAVHRKGRNLRNEINTLRLAEGDTLLMMGSNKAIEQLRTKDDILLLDKPRTPAQNMRRKMPIAVAIALGLIAAASLELMPIVGVTTIAVALLILTGCLKAKEAYASVDWSILIIIYGMLALGRAMEVSGASLFIAGGATGFIQQVAPVAWQPILVLAIVYFITSLFTEFLSNNAAVALMVPIAIGLAVAMGMDPRPLVIGICIAASASFATPIGYQTNTYVYSVGGYRFGDFARIGIPLNLLYFVVSVLLIPRIWPFFP
ncbi:MAG: SLC13 family permease [Opitutales bacterium]|nr:SLC13 family permease [Opitutales bacterium]